MGNSESMDKLLEELTDEDLQFQKYILMRSINVKRSFFWHKNFKKILAVQ